MTHSDYDATVMFKDKQRLMHHTYDVFARVDKNEIIDTKLVKRTQSTVMCDVDRESFGDGNIVCWLLPEDHRFIFSGTIISPLAWFEEGE